LRVEGEGDVRNMSFALTTAQVRAGTKTVTRRFGWWDLKPGDLVQPVVKGMGLKKGEKVQKIRGPIRIVSVRTERVRNVTVDDVAREGFPGWPKEAFIGVLTDNFRKAGLLTPVNRIAFEYTDGAVP
jgi:hypothetical protein